MLRVLRVRPGGVIGFALAMVVLASGPLVQARDPIPADAAVTPMISPFEIEGLAMLLQVADQLSGFVTNKDLAAIHNEDETLGLAANELLRRADGFMGAQRAPLFKTNLTEFTQQVGSL